jgi:hypothetical protein
MEVSDQLHGRFTSEKRASGSLLIADREVPIAGLDAVE